MADDRELDDLLDCALSTYADQEPDASLRARISSRVEDVTPHPWRMGLLAGTASCAAAVLCTVLLHPAVHSPVRQPDTAPSVTSNPASPARSVEAQQRVQQPRYVLSARQQRKSHPHAVALSASLPTPGPMTNEESLLLKFVTDHPEQARQILAHRDTALETKPISIAPIRIAALSDVEQAQPWQ